MKVRDLFTHKYEEKTTPPQPTNHHLHGQLIHAMRTKDGQGRICRAVSVQICFFFVFLDENTKQNKQENKLEKKETVMRHSLTRNINVTGTKKR